MKLRASIAKSTDLAYNFYEAQFVKYSAIKLKWKDIGLRDRLINNVQLESTHASVSHLCYTG